MFGVVVCPRCRRAKGVDLTQKTTACSCGFEIRVVPARVRAKAPTARGLAALVGQANAELAGGLDTYRRDAAPRPRRRSQDVHARVAGKAAKAGDRAHRIHAVAVALSEELEVFSRDDWRRVLERLGIPAADDALEGLVQRREVYEPTPGFYRAVSLTP
ncbi:MAG TPA: hypothetical protein VJ326_01695 [Thermoplasmata archaeon]|nr:hypothetical protein [Thermoplasmata archaeon]